MTAGTFLAFSSIQVAVIDFYSYLEKVIKSVNWKLLNADEIMHQTDMRHVGVIIIL